MRRALRATQLGLGVLLTLSLLQVLLAPAALGDNCGAFTDCFGVANSALEAAFGLSLLAVLSLVLDFLPIVGTGKGLIEAVTGRDLLTGEELAEWERALGFLPILGGLGALKYADDLVGAGRHTDVPAGTGRGADDPPGAGRSADEAPKPSTWDEGTRRALDPTYRSLVEDYVGGTTAQRNKLSEQIGELGGLQYLRETTGRNIDLLRPTANADVADLRGLMDAGQPWPHAIAFGGSRATNIVYFDGRKLIVVEAKGGGSGYGDRRGSVIVDPTRSDGRIDQTHPEYPYDVAADMKKNSSLNDGRNEVGDLIQQAYGDVTLEYVAVRTGGYAALVAGRPQVILEHVFLLPQ